MYIGDNKTLLIVSMYRPKEQKYSMIWTDN